MVLVLAGSGHAGGGRGGGKSRRSRQLILSLVSGSSAKKP